MTRRRQPPFCGNGCTRTRRHDGDGSRRSVCRVLSAVRRPEFASAGFRPLNEKPAPAPVEDRLAAQNAAVAEALAAAQAEFDAVREADRSEFEQRLAAREAEILASVGESLSGQVAEGLSAIEERVGQAVSAVLLRFLDHAVRERAVNELSEAVSALLAGGGAASVKIAGPAALSERVERSIAPTGVTVERIDSDAADILRDHRRDAGRDQYGGMDGPADGAGGSGGRWLTPRRTN